jgi:hypothetical protein
MWILTFVILLCEDGLGMDESTRQELLKSSIAFEEKNEDIVGTVRLQLFKIYDQKNGDSRLRAGGERDKK